MRWAGYVRKSGRGPEKKDRIRKEKEHGLISGVDDAYVVSSVV
jgi:hypothetical protein